MSSRRLASWSLALLLFSATLLLLSWPLGIAGNPYDEKRLLVTTLLLGFVMLFLLVPPLRRMWQAQLATMPRFVSRILLMVLLLGLLSAWRAQLPGAAMTEVALWVVLVSALVGVAALRRELGVGFEQALLAMFALLLLIFLLLLCGYLLQALLGSRELDLRLFFLNFSLPRFFNQVQSWTLSLVVLPLLYAEQRGWKILQGVLLVAAANWWTLLFLTGGRGAMLAMVVAMVLVTLLLRRRAVRWLKWQLLALLGGLLFYGMITLLVKPQYTESLARASLSGRSELWRHAVAMIVDHPLLGVGPMHFACGEGVLNAHPHNVLLQFAAEWGLPAALLVAVLLLWLLYQGVTAIRLSPPAADTLDIAPTLLASLFAATAHAQLSGIVVMPLSQLMLVVVGGWSWGALAAQTGEDSCWRLSDLIWMGAFVVALVVLSERLAPVWERVTTGERFVTAQLTDYLPRFWADGLICREGSGWRR